MAVDSKVSVLTDLPLFLTKPTLFSTSLNPNLNKIKQTNCGLRSYILSFNEQVLSVLPCVKDNLGHFFGATIFKQLGVSRDFVLYKCLI